MGSIFEGISLNHRNVGSLVGTEQKLSASTALRTEASRQHMNIGWTPFLSENGLFLEKEPAGGKSVEQSPPKNGGDCSTSWPSAHYFRSIIQPITKMSGKPKEQYHKRSIKTSRGRERSAPMVGQRPYS
jgi:hypothetical protein